MYITIDFVLPCSFLIPAHSIHFICADLKILEKNPADTLLLTKLQNVLRNMKRLLATRLYTSKRYLDFLEIQPTQSQWAIKEQIG